MTAIALWVLAAVLAVIVWKRFGWGEVRAGCRLAVSRAAVMFPLITLIIIVGGFVIYLLPAGLVASLLGPGTGMGGIALATVLGAFIPGGASISFPIIILLSDAGAGTVQLVTLMTAWATLGVHRIFIHEVPLLGPRFAVMRFLVSLPLPAIGALITYLLLPFLPGGLI